MTTPSTSVAPAELTLDRVVSHWAERRPKDFALRWQEAGVARSRTWNELELAISATARCLRDSVVAGDSVAVVCANSAEFHVLVNALWRLGASVLLLDRHWGATLVIDLVQLVDCRAIFAERPSLLGEGFPLPVQSYPLIDWDSTAEAPAERETAESHLDGVALYASTSGTTDDPKCVPITHRQIRAAYRACFAAHDFSHVTHAACLFEINSLGVLGVCFLMPREVGACTTAYPSFTLANISSTWASLLDDGVDFIYLVPPLVRLLTRLAGRLNGRERRILSFCAAAPVAQAELQDLEAKAPLQVFNCYGLTELTFAVFFGCRGEDGNASESIGLPIHIEARLVDAQGCDLPSGAAEGELLITGPMLTSGYLHNPRATVETWVDGWLRTGDLAKRDERGRYFICGRKKDIVLRGGYTHYLNELEHYLRRVPHVVDACAFRGRNLPSGDELVVVVHALSDVSAKGLLAWIGENLGSTKVPNAVYVWRRTLPRNSNGKVLRNQLANLHRNGALRDEGLS